MDKSDKQETEEPAPPYSPVAPAGCGVALPLPGRADFWFSSNTCRLGPSKCCKLTVRSGPGPTELNSLLEKKWGQAESVQGQAINQCM